MPKTGQANSFKFSGRIWAETSIARRKVVSAVCDALQGAYGTPRLGNPKRPVDDLIYIVISNKTNPAMAEKVYRRLKETHQNWEDLLDSRPAVLRSILKPAGLSTVKSRQLRAALQIMRGDFGKCDLRSLRGKTEAEIHSYLTALPGVSDKVARCVMMYTMGAKVLPVDSHVHRIASRLGWTARKRADQCHEELESLVPPDRRYAFHVDAVLHGRKVCRPERPECDRCCIRRYCGYFRILNAKY